MPTHEREEIIQSVIKAISQVKGIRRITLLSDGWRKRIIRLEEEAQQKTRTTIPTVNRGMQEALSRQVLVAILHDSEFEHPSEPTIVLVSKDVVIGEEVWREDELEKMKHDDNTTIIGSSFAIFRDKARLSKGRPSEFVFPPIPFKPLDNIRRVKHAVSASLHTVTDFKLRKRMGWDSSDPSLATILVGFDLSEET